MPLVISRKYSQSLELFTADGEQITVTVVDLNHKSVRLAIDAPDGVKIVRSELLDDSVG